MLGLTFFLGACTIIVGSLWLSGDPMAFWSGASAVLVVLGTLATTGVSLQPGDARPVWCALKALFARPQSDARPTARLLLDLSARVRRDGPVVLEKALLGVRDRPFLKRALELVADGLPHDSIEAILNAEIEAEGRRRGRLAELLRRGADIAPAMGLIGTLIGLVGVMRDLDDPARIGPAMAIALLTTLYGAVLAHIVLLPLAHRAEAQADAETAHLKLIVAGAAALGQGEHPLHLESKLNALLPPTERVQAA